jgi:hypothetical protein
MWTILLRWTLNVRLLVARGPLSGRCYECASASRLSLVRGLHYEEITNNRWLLQAFGYAAVRACVACGQGNVNCSERYADTAIFVCLSVCLCCGCQYSVMLSGCVFNGHFIGRVGERIDRGLLWNSSVDRQKELSIQISSASPGSETWTWTSSFRSSSDKNSTAILLLLLLLFVRSWKNSKQMYSVVLLAASDRHCADRWNWSLLQRTWRYFAALILINVFLLHSRYYLWNVVCTLFTLPFLFD